jgi:hypothetical protein
MRLELEDCVDRPEAPLLSVSARLSGLMVLMRLIVGEGVLLAVVLVAGVRPAQSASGARMQDNPRASWSTCSGETWGGLCSRDSALRRPRQAPRTWASGTRMERSRSSGESMMFYSTFPDQVLGLRK